MKLANPWRCDGPACGQVKGETNHWLLIFASDPRKYSAQVWDEVLANSEHQDGKPVFLHICSAECAAKIQSIWIAKATQKTRESSGEMAWTG